MRRIFILAFIAASAAGQTACTAAAETGGAGGVPAPAAAPPPIDRAQAVAVQLGAERINRQLPNEFDNRLYLNVPVDPRGLTRFAGAVLSFYGDVHADGTCTPDTDRAPSLDMRLFLRDSAHPQIELLSLLKYQSIMDRTAAASASLVVANLALRDSQLAEVIVEDIAKVEAVPALDYDALEKMRQDTLPLGVCSRAVIAAAYLTSIKSRVYRQTGGSGVVTGMGFGLDGKFFVSNSDFGSNLLLSVDARIVTERRRRSGSVSGIGGIVRGLFPAPVYAGDPAMTDGDKSLEP